MFASSPRSRGSRRPAPSIPEGFTVDEDAAGRESSSGLRYRHLTYRPER